MIYVDEDQLAEVQYLLHQSTLGNHILFDNETICRIAPEVDSLGQPLTFLDTEMGERLLEELILCPTIEAKQHFLRQLDSPNYDAVARVYLRIVENQAQESAYKH